MALASEHPLSHRILHGLHLLCMVVLSVSGFYIHYPFVPGLMGTMRYLHFVAMYLFVVTLVIRIYLVFVGVNRDLPEWRLGRREWTGLVQTVRYYLFLAPEPAKTGKYNPLQKLTYYFIALLMIFQTLTGFSLYWREHPFFAWLLGLVGGLANMRSIHFVTMWVFFAIVLGHVYMVFTEAYDRFLLMFFGIQRKPEASH